MSDLKVEGFLIHAAGDESVGIWSQEWELKPSFYFNDEEDLNHFKEALREAFENGYVGDTNVTVCTFEEREEENKMDAEYEKMCDESEEKIREEIEQMKEGV